MTIYLSPAKITDSTTDNRNSIYDEKKQEFGNDSVKMPANFFELLASIDAQSSEAKLNETTMSDNNGGRIEL
jgi:hypothetical protein